MRNTLACPKCSCRQLFVVEKVQQPDGAEAGGYPLVVTYDVADPKNWLRRRYEAGYFEAWVCTACGFTELYARDANAMLGAMAQSPDSRVRFVDGNAAQGTYR